MQAEVLRSEVTRDRSSIATTYGVAIEFRYTVNGTDYIAPTSLGYTTSSYSSMKLEADFYGPGTRHVIHYDSEEPN